MPINREKRTKTKEEYRKDILNNIFTASPILILGATLFAFSFEVLYYLKAFLYFVLLAFISFYSFSFTEKKFDIRPKVIFSSWIAYLILLFLILFIPIPNKLESEFKPVTTKEIIKLKNVDFYDNTLTIVDRDTEKVYSSWSNKNSYYRIKLIMEKYKECSNERVTSTKWDSDTKMTSVKYCYNH